MLIIKKYEGRVPACGCFCGGCPFFVRERKPCLGAAYTDRCDGCKTFHLCCQDRGIEHCHQCEKFPCRKFKDFRKRWLKYGQDFLENQAMLKNEGAAGFLDRWNAAAGTEIDFETVGGKQE